MGRLPKGAARPSRTDGVSLTAAETNPASPSPQPEILAEMFAKAFAINPAAIGIVRLDNGMIIDVNESWQAMFGYSRDEAVGHSAINLRLWLAKEDRDRYLKELHEKGFFRDREQMVLRKSGESFVSLCSAELMTIADQRFILSTWLDISERRRAEEALRESEERFAAFMSHLPAVAFVKDEADRTLFVNRYLQELTGIENWRDQSMQSLFPDQLRRQTDSENSKALSRGYLKVQETVVDSHGVSRIFETIRFPIRVAQTTSLLGGIAVDITERKQAEEELRESKEKLALALRSSGMGVWRLDLREQKRYFDENVCRCLGIDPICFNGTPEEFYAAVHPADRNRMKTALDKTIATGAPYATEYRVVWPDGSLHFITSRGRLERDTDGKALRINGLVWDITEQKKAEEALREANQQYVTIAKCSPDLVWSMDLSGRFTYLSPRVEHMHGWIVEEALKLGFRDSATRRRSPKTSSF